MRWVITDAVKPPIDHVILAQSGGSLFFCAFFKWRNEWEMIYPGGSERIDPPQMIYLDEDYIKENTISIFTPIKPEDIVELKPQQMELL